MAEILVDAEACSTTMVEPGDPLSAPDSFTIQDKDVEYMVIVHLDDSYLRTIPGLLRFLQVVISVIALICVTSSGTSEYGYLLLPLSWHLRVFVFVAVCGFLTSLISIVLHVTGLINMLPIDWDVFDMSVYSALSILFLFAASMVASALDYFHTIKADVTEWTLEQLLVAVIFGYIDMALFAASAALSYSSWKGITQFMSRRFSSRSQQAGTSSDNPAV